MLTTKVTSDKIAVALGVDSPADGSVTQQQWQMWIKDALLLIQTRATAMGDPAVDQAKLDYVIREAVVAHARRPDDATQVTVSVDDGSTSKTYRTGAGRVAILDEWWRMLGLAPRKSAAFETDTMPADATPGEVLDYSLYYEPGWYPIDSGGVGGDWS